LLAHLEKKMQKKNQRLLKLGFPADRVAPIKADYILFYTEVIPAISKAKDMKIHPKKPITVKLGCGLKICTILVFSKLESTKFFNFLNSLCFSIFSIL
jgi:hypothetical protein